MLTSRRRFLFLGVAALSSTKLRADASKKLRVVASFSILADFVKQVGRERVELATLAGANADAHNFATTPDHAKLIAAADIVFYNGLGFDNWVKKLHKSSSSKALLVQACKNIEALKTKEDEHHDHHHDMQDPHAWQSVENAQKYVTEIRDALVAADTQNKLYYETNAIAYLSELKALDREIKNTLEQIDPAQRKIITSHDAFSYFSKAYGVEFLPAQLSPQVEPGAQQIARLIKRIKDEKIQGIFVENISDPRILQQISRETNAKIGGTLFSDALSDDKGPAPTYIAMMKHNLQQLVAALSS